MVDVVLKPLTRPEYDLDVEIVERKGVGHPDTLCDALAEQLSLHLSRFYEERFGTILHHNVDKALLRGGVSVAHFGGGEVREPIEIYLAGRAVTNVGGVTVPVQELAKEGTRAFLREHLHALDVDRHVRVHCLVRPGSVDLRELYGRSRERGVPLANDTSFGAAYAPRSSLECLVLDLERDLNSSGYIARHPAQGEDVKIMAYRSDADVSVTVARAFVAAHVPSLDAYALEKRSLEAYVAERAASRFPSPTVHVNAADATDGSAVYLTVTGTSAESGDDGEVGRGNRANGLITPLRPMSLEALAGKNSVSHVGKLYNLCARAIADAVVAGVSGAAAAECYLVSRIGAPIDEPALACVRLGGETPPSAAARRAVTDIVHAELARMPELRRRLLEGSEQLF